MKPKAIALYAFQNPETTDLENPYNEDHICAAILLGEELARLQITLVTGGMKDGLMGLVATTALNAGGHVIGVIPQDFPAKDRHPGITDLRIVKNGYERKERMMALTDASITLAGGVGTLAEYFNEQDIMKEIKKNYAQAETYQIAPDRPVILLDPTEDRFYSPLKSLFRNMGLAKKKQKRYPCPEHRHKRITSPFGNARAVSTRIRYKICATEKYI